MARRRGTSRITEPGTVPGPDAQRRTAEPAGLPSLRERRPFLFWGLMVAMAALILPVFLSLFQAIA
jgi:hypothetical protein